MSVDMSELCHSFPYDDTCTTRYVHVLYVGCGRGSMRVENRCTRVVEGCVRDWFGMGHWSKLTMDDCE